MVQSIQGTLTALHAVCRDTIFANQTGADGAKVLVSMGDPGQYQAATIVAVGVDIRLPITRPTAGTGRSREQAAEIDVVISVYVPGGEEAQATANNAALTLQGLLETHFRTKPNEELGGACREAFPSNAHLVPSVAFQTFDDPQVAPVVTGRIAENTVTVTAHIRY